MHASPHYGPPPVAVQFIGQLAFGIFAIVATVMAFDASWVAGVIVVLALGSIGFGNRHDRWRNWRSERAETCRTVAVEPAAGEPAAAETTRTAATGNAVFDAYRADVLKRLEEEQASFVAFLDRLREARDKAELDRFMADRVRSTAALTADPPDAARTGDY